MMAEVNLSKKCEIEHATDNINVNSTKVWVQKCAICMQITVELDSPVLH